jgi:hypothetical protein
MSRFVAYRLQRFKRFFRNPSMLTADMLDRRLAARAAFPHRRSSPPPPQFELATPLRLAHFLAHFLAQAFRRMRGRHAV